MKESVVVLATVVRAKLLPKVRRGKYNEIAKTILSARTVGSITGERVAKTLKNKVLAKDLNKLGVGRAETLLRVGMNLRLLNKHKKMMQQMGLLQC